jgi:hypothetical protein
MRLNRRRQQERQSPSSSTLCETRPIKHPLSALLVALAVGYLVRQALDLLLQLRPPGELLLQLVDAALTVLQPSTKIVALVAEVFALGAQ